MNESSSGSAARATAPARIETFSPEAGRRILVTSDIHTNIPYFEGMLRRAGFCDGDWLIIDGDFLEKGRDSLGMLRYMMEFSRRPNVKIVLGNCDNWERAFTGGPESCGRTEEYMRRFRRGILWDMVCDSGYDPMTAEFAAVREEIRERYRAEWDFLWQLPHAIITDRFVFAHAGADPAKPFKENTVQDFTRTNALLTLGYRFEKWVISGHWPVVLYGENTVCANPIIDRGARIVSIDGGCTLKDDGQLNCLIIPDRDSEDFRWVYYDPFPVRTVKTDQTGGGPSYYIRWGDSTVRVLERGEEFSRCRHLRTGYEMEILTKYLFTDGETTDCNDCTDYVLPLAAGDRVSVVESTSRGYFVKHDGVSGWYYGELT